MPGTFFSFFFVDIYAAVWEINVPAVLMLGLFEIKFEIVRLWNGLRGIVE